MQTSVVVNKWGMLAVCSFSTVRFLKLPETTCKTNKYFYRVLCIFNIVVTYNSGKSTSNLQF